MKGHKERKQKMKKSALISFILLGVVLTGCSNVGNMGNQEQNKPASTRGEITVETITQANKTASSSNTADTQTKSSANQKAVQNTTNNNEGNQTANGSITEAQAKKIALEHAQLAEKDVTMVKAHLTMDDGRQIYEVEFYQNGTIFKEYDYEIDAQTGTIVNYDFDAENYQAQNNNGNQANQTGSNTQITEAEVRKTVLSRINGANDSHVSYIKLEMDDGMTIYEGKAVYNAQEYEFEINAQTGAVISWEVESIYD